MKKRISIIMIFVMLVSLAWPSIPGGQVSAASTIAGVDGTSVDYDELDGEPVLAMPNLALSGADFDSNSYVEFDITDARDGEHIGLEEVPDMASISTVNGEISVYQGIVYKGDGSSYEAIANVDSVYNGQNGTKLRIVFKRILPNANFMDGNVGSVFADGDTLIGWTVSNGTFSLYNADPTLNLNLRSMGTVYSDMTGAGPTLISGTDINSDAYTYTSDWYNVPIRDQAWGYESVERPLGNLNTSVVIDDSQGGTGGRALKLTSSGSVIRDNSGASDPINPASYGGGIRKYGSHFGPVIVSDQFSAKANEELSIDWKAIRNSDDYEVYGYIQNVDSGVYTLVFYGRGANQEWTTSTGTVPVDGNYKFVFINGTYDQTGGYAVGSSMWIDNIQVYGTTYSAVTVNNIALKVNYSSTEKDPEDTRTLNIKVVDEDGEGSAVTASSTINIINQFDHPPTLSSNGLNPAYNKGGAGEDAVFDSTLSSTIEDEDSINSLTMTVSGLQDGVSEILMIDGSEIVLSDGQSGTTTDNEIDYTVSEEAGTATVILTHTGLTEAQVNSLIDGVKYKNAKDIMTLGNRVVSLTQVVDTGSSDGKNENTSNLSISSTITVNNVISDLSVDSRTNTSAVLSWTPAVGATNLQIQQSTDGGNNWTNSTYDPISNDASTATITGGLSPSQSYKFRILATGGDNAGISNSADLDPISDDTLLVSSSYSIPSGQRANETITNIRKETSLSDFLSGISKNQRGQVIDSSGLNDPVETGDTIIVTAEDGTTVTTYTLDVNLAKLSSGSPSNTMVYVNNPTVKVNGISEVAAKESALVKSGVKEVRVETLGDILEAKIEEVLKNEKPADGNLIEIEVQAEDYDSLELKLTGDIIKRMENDKFDLRVNTEGIDYLIPADEVGIDNVAKILKVDPNQLETIEVFIDIERISQSDKDLVLKAIDDNGFEMILEPIEFKVRAKTTNENGEIEEVIVSEFTSYVKRVVELPEDSEGSKITTGVFYNEDGTFSHIPTVVFKDADDWYAEMNSMTNSNYSVIWNPIEVESVKGHWSEEAVNDMASRLVVKDVEEFEPDAPISRGEFTEYLVKAVGLHRTAATVDGLFTDLTDDEDESAAIAQALKYGIVKGYPDGSFMSNTLISREEAMLMFNRTMNLIEFSGDSQEAKMATFKDSDKVSLWAYDGVKETVEAGIFNGYSATELGPQEYITYAEAAQSVRNLLVEGNLINED